MKSKGFPATLLEMRDYRFLSLALSVFICCVSLAPVRGASHSSEREVIDEAVRIARTGALGFTLPEYWTYDYDPRYGACGRIFNTGCLVVASDTPIDEDGNLERVWALTTRSGNNTLFFRGSGMGNEAITIAYSDPSRDAMTVSILAPQAFTDLEMAVYVLAHEVQGHLIFGLTGQSPDELIGNYYGLSAVRALRALR